MLEINFRFYVYGCLEGSIFLGIPTLPCPRWSRSEEEERDSVDDAAEFLSNCEIDELFLDGLAELSDAAAESLSKYNGDLSLTGLKSLGDNAAASFSKFKGSCLDFNRHPDWQPAPCQPSYRLTKLSDAAAKSLAKIDSEKLRLTDELEKQVAKYR